VTPPTHPPAHAPTGSASPAGSGDGLSLSPYRRRPDGWSQLAWIEYARIRRSLRFFDLPANAAQEILECLHSTEWNWYEDCDGCTGVSEPGWPSKYFPPCVRHDYDCQTGRGGWQANARFDRLNRAYRMDGWRCRARWVGVAVWWYTWGRWTR
jgi:hypothetical protein